MASGKMKVIDKESKVRSSSRPIVALTMGRLPVRFILDKKKYLRKRISARPIDKNIGNWEKTGLRKQLLSGKFWGNFCSDLR